MEDSFSAPCRNSKRFRILECDVDFRLNVTDVFHKHVLTISFRDGLLPYRNTQDNKSHVSMITRSCTVIKSCFGPFVLSCYVLRLHLQTEELRTSIQIPMLSKYLLYTDCVASAAPRSSPMPPICVCHASEHKWI